MWNPFPSTFSRGTPILTTTSCSNASTCGRHLASSSVERSIRNLANSSRSVKILIRSPGPLGVVDTPTGRIHNASQGCGAVVGALHIWDLAGHAGSLSWPPLFRYRGGTRLVWGRTGHVGDVGPPYRSSWDWSLRSD